MNRAALHNRWLLALIFWTVVTSACRKKVVKDVPAQRVTVEWESKIDNPGITSAEFTKFVAEAVREEMPDAKVVVAGPLVLNVTSPAITGELVCHLDNPWNVGRDAPEARVQAVRQHVDALRSAAMGMSVDKPLSVDDVVPVIKDEVWLEQLRREGTDVAYQQIAADILVAFAEDGAEQIRFLNRVEVDSLGLSPKEVLAKSTKNLRARLPKVERIGDGPLFMLAAGGTFEASLLLLDDVWAEHAPVVDGRLVVAVPSRELILFAGDKDKASLQKMRSIVAGIHQDGSYLVSQSLLVRDGEAWKAFPAD